MASLAAVRFAMGLTCSDHFQHAKGRDRLREAGAPVRSLARGAVVNGGVAEPRPPLEPCRELNPKYHQVMKLQNSVQAIVQGL